ENACAASLGDMPCRYGAGDPSSIPMDYSRSVHPAMDAFDATPSEPLAPVIFRARGLDPAPLFAYWRQREPGTLTSRIRYRWEISHRRTAIPSWARAPEEWRAWRPVEQQIVDRDPFDFEERIVVPILVAECAELLLESKGGEDLLEEAEPAFRRDLAMNV